MTSASSWTALKVRSASEVAVNALLSAPLMRSETLMAFASSQLAQKVLSASAIAVPALLCAPRVRPVAPMAFAPYQSAQRARLGMTLVSASMPSLTPAQMVRLRTTMVIVLTSPVPPS